jgi:hypothetical protein
MESGAGVEKNDDGASSRIAACGLHPGYKGGYGAGFVARMESGAGVEKTMAVLLPGLRPAAFIRATKAGQ